MRMLKVAAIMMLAAASPAMVIGAHAAGVMRAEREAERADDEERAVTRVRRFKASRPARGRGLQAKPRKRPNMRIVSKRVRRRHRRAA